jgi:hypothetical protein
MSAAWGVFVIYHYFSGLEIFTCYVGESTGLVEWILGSECRNLQGMYRRIHVRGKFVLIYVFASSAEMYGITTYTRSSYHILSFCISVLFYKSLTWSDDRTP